jgi:hypothetical protein
MTLGAGPSLQRASANFVGRNFGTIKQTTVFDGGSRCYSRAIGH